MTFGQRWVCAALVVIATGAPALTIDAQVGKSQGVVDANTVPRRRTCARMPRMTPAIVECARSSVRPFASITGAQRLPARPGTHPRPVAMAFYEKAFVHVNLNTGTARTRSSSCPRAGQRMVREFAEYRPWKTWAQFAKEIGKYVRARRRPRSSRSTRVHPGAPEHRHRRGHPHHSRARARACSGSSRSTAPGRPGRSSTRKSASTWTRKKLTASSGMS